MRPRIILPLINVVASVIAILLDNLRPLHGINPQPSAFLLTCYLVSAPILVVRSAIGPVLGKIIPDLCSAQNPDPCYLAERLTLAATYLAGIGVLWYLVGYGIEALRQGSDDLIPFRGWRRASLDSALILLGVLCGFVAVMNFRETHFVLHLPLASLSYGVWVFVLVVPCVRDLSKQRDRKYIATG